MELLARWKAVNRSVTVLSFSAPRPTSDPSGSLDLVVSAIQERIDKQSLRTTIVDVDAITSVVADLSSSDEDLAQESIQLFDAFNAPKLYFDEKLKSHRLIAPAAYHLLSSSEMRADMYRQRLLFTQQRLLRSERFALKGMGTSSSKPSGTVHDISTIEALLGSSGIKVLFGMLTQPEEGSWFLEDLVSIIRLDLSRAQTFSGFLTEGSQVIVQGELRTGTFSVEVRRLMQRLLLTGIGLLNSSSSSS
jgi:DNA polymerase epsilon subunit 2